MNLCTRMQPIRLLMRMQRQQLFHPHFTKLTATALPSLSSIHNSAQGSTPYSFSRPMWKVFPNNSAPLNKFWPVSFSQSQEIFTLSASRSRQGIGHDSQEAPADNPVTSATLAVRLANENGFLSWCRNSYLATAVGVGMDAEGSAALSSMSYETVFMVAGLNLTLGTSIFIFNTLKLRHHMGLSSIGAAGFAIGAFTHLLFWIFGLLTYSGYIVEDSDHKLKSKKGIMKK